MERKDDRVRFKDLRAILHYVPMFRGKRFVVAVDGAVLAQGRLTNLLLDLAVLQSLNIQVVLVHGAGQQIQELAEQRRVTISTVDGTGKTDAATLELSLDAIKRLANRLFQQATVAGVRAASANVLIAHPAGRVKGKDMGLTGIIDRVDARCLESFLNEGLLPVISPLGYDREGKTLRLNSDSAATEIAIALKAAKILFVTTGTLSNAQGERVRQLSFTGAEKLAAIGEAMPALCSKLKYAARACREGVARVHIVNGLETDALLAELFSNEGTGTMVYADAYQEVRQATAADVPAIITMIQQSVSDDELLPRTADDVRARLSDYWVIEIDQHVVGCVALHPFPEHEQIEMACLFVRRLHENQGYGRKLVEFAIRKASELGAKRLFALTTGARAFFQRCGFQRGNRAELPPERLAKWEASGRKSEVVIVPLRGGE